MAITSQPSEDDAAATLPPPEREPRPEGSVTLHQFCDNCTHFFQNWGFLDWISKCGESWLQFWSGDLKSIDERSRWQRLFKEVTKNYELCSVKHVLQFQGCCHFCKTLSYLLDTSRAQTDTMVMLSVRDLKNYHRYDYFEIITYLAGKETIDDPWWASDRQTLCIRWLNAKESNAFDAPELGSRIPRRSIDNLAQMKQWLKGCMQHHQTCSNQQSTYDSKSADKLPKRIVDISSDSVRLECDVSGLADFKYLTLSHVWGTEPSQQLRLLSSRLEEFENAIPSEEIPQIFREAIRITRYLGYRYLWIDSLCIVQDSTADWTTEAAKMATVYSHAVCNLAFILPPNVFDYTREDPRCSTPCVVRWDPVSASSISISPLKLLPMPRSSDLYSWLQHNHWPWSSRAWILQEYLLSRRTIFCGHQNIMWECAEVFCDELLGSWLTRTILNIVDSMVYRNPLRKTHVRKCDTTFERMELWWQLVENYRQRTLSRASDRIMAFAGVAEAFRVEQGLTYLAGIWAESFPHGLFWWVSEPCKDGLAVASSTPSWSWFRHTLSESNNVPLNYCGPESRGGSKSIFSATIMHFQWPGQSPNLLPPTSFHDFAGLELSVKLVTWSATLQKQDTSKGHLIGHRQVPSLYSSDFEQQVIHQCGGLQQLELRYTALDTAFFEYFPDDSKDAETPHDNVVLALLDEEHEVMHRFGTTRLHGQVYNYHMKGLGIEPAEKHGTWKRVGFWRASIRRKLENNELDLGAKEASLFLRFKGVKVETITLI